MTGTMTMTTFSDTPNSPSHTTDDLTISDSDLSDTEHDDWVVVSSSSSTSTIRTVPSQIALRPGRGLKGALPMGPGPGAGRSSPSCSLIHDPEATARLDTNGDDVVLDEHEEVSCGVHSSTPLPDETSPSSGQPSPAFLPSTISTESTAQTSVRTQSEAPSSPLPPCSGTSKSPPPPPPPRRFHNPKPCHNPDPSGEAVKSLADTLEALQRQLLTLTAIYDRSLSTQSSIRPLRVPIPIDTTGYHQNPPTITTRLPYLTPQLPPQHHRVLAQITQRPRCPAMSTSGDSFADSWSAINPDARVTSTIPTRTTTRLETLPSRTCKYPHSPRGICSWCPRIG